MNKKIVLVYEMAMEKCRQLEMAMKPLKIQVQKVSKSQYNAPVGSVALGQQAAGGVNKPASVSPQNGTGVLPFASVPQMGEMVVFSGVTPEDMDDVLAALKKAGLVIPLKATITMYNFSWSGYGLYQELDKEHRQMTK